jgi:hypothetical protein
LVHAVWIVSLSAWAMSTATMALAEMAGDADQPVLPPIPRKHDAIIGLEGGLI